MTRPVTHGPLNAYMDYDSGQTQREDGEAKGQPVSLTPGNDVQLDMSPPAWHRYENNRSDARRLAEDAAALLSRQFGPVRHDEIALAQAKALTSIALNMAFSEELR